MKEYFIIILLFPFSIKSGAQNAGIGTTNPDASAQLEIAATGK